MRPALSACKRATSDTLPQLQPLSVGLGNHRAWCSNVWTQWTMHYASLPLIPETVRESRAADTPTAYPLTAHPSRSAGCGPPDVQWGGAAMCGSDGLCTMHYALCTMDYGLCTMHNRLWFLRPSGSMAESGMLQCGGVCRLTSR